MISYTTRYSAHWIRASQSLKTIRGIILTIAAILFIAQVCIDFSYANVIVNIFSLLSTFLVLFGVYNKPVSSVGYGLVSALIVMSVLSNSIAPAVGTLLEGHSMVYNLKVPLTVFFHRFIFAIVLVCVWKVLLFLPPSKRVQQLMTYCSVNGFFTPEKIWIFWIIAICAFAMKFLPFPNALEKILDVMTSFAWFPSILLLPIYQPYITNKRKHKIYMILYFIVSITFGLIANSRMGIVGPFAVLLFGVLVLLHMGDIYIDKKKIKKQLIWMLVAFFILGQFQDLSKAMLVERKYRTMRSGEEQLNATISTFLDKSQLDEEDDLKSDFLYRSIKKDRWEEQYVRNGFLARFMSIKSDDNCFYRAERFNDIDVQLMTDATIDKILAQFPEPLIVFLNLNFDKVNANYYSIGDWFEMLHNPNANRGLRTGSVLAHAFVLVGWWYVLIMMVLFSIVFFLLTITLNHNNKTYVISSLGLFIGLDLFHPLFFDGAHSLVSFIIRGYWQTIIIFMLMIIIAKVLNRKKTVIN